MKDTFVKKLNSFQKLLIGLALGFIAFFIAQTDDFGELTPVMIGWDTFGLSYLIIEWITFFKTKANEIRKQASRQDPKRTIVFTMILIATLFSILAIVLMIISKEKAPATANWRIPVAILGMVLSWFLVHTVFTLRYAHIFYGNDVENPSNHAGGLEFPGKEKPNYLDFAYFAFVLGMTFQVSDVQITSKNIRKIALLHGLISFAFTTIIFAVVINVTSGG